MAAYDAKYWDEWWGRQRAVPLLPSISWLVFERLSQKGPRRLRAFRRYSHSIVPGGLEVMSKTTRLTSGTSLTMRLEMRASRS